jgi:hypothetical protein
MFRLQRRIADVALRLRRLFMERERLVVIAAIFHQSADADQGIRNVFFR